MEKATRSKLALITIAGLFSYAMLSSADSTEVHIGDTLNGVTNVSCAGGCTVEPKWYGRNVCDAKNSCATVRGKFRIVPMVKQTI